MVRLSAQTAGEKHQGLFLVALLGEAHGLQEIGAGQGRPYRLSFGFDLAFLRPSCKDRDGA